METMSSHNLLEDSSSHISIVFIYYRPSAFNWSWCWSASSGSWNGCWMVLQQHYPLPIWSRVR